MMVSEVKLPRKAQIILILGFWMTMVGIFWQHLFATFVPNILRWRAKWELPLEIEMNISVFNWVNSKESMQQMEMPRFAEIGPYTFKQESVHEKYARDYVIRPKFEEHLRKKFYCIAKCGNLHTDTITTVNWKLLEAHFGDRKTATDDLWWEEKAINVTFDSFSLNLVSLASNMDIFDMEIVTFDRNHSIAINATGINRTVQLFADHAETIHGIGGDRFSVRRAHLFTPEDEYYSPNFLRLSRTHEDLPLFIAMPNISIVVEPTFSMIISAIYDLEFVVMLPYHRKVNAWMFLPVLRVCQKGSMYEEAREYMELHRTFMHIAKHFAVKIVFIIGIVSIICTLGVLWERRRNYKVNLAEQHELENLS